MILADTSVWVEHFRGSLPPFVQALQSARICMHPFVRGELACGNLRNRRPVLELLGQLPASAVATDDEVMKLIERRALVGRGIGWVDAHLIASVLLMPTTRLWTHDRRLAIAADALGVGYDGDG